MTPALTNTSVQLAAVAPAALAVSAASSGGVVASPVETEAPSGSVRGTAAEACISGSALRGARSVAQGARANDAAGGDRPAGPVWVSRPRVAGAAQDGARADGATGGDCPAGTAQSNWSLDAVLGPCHAGATGGRAHTAGVVGGDCPTRTTQRICRAGSAALGAHASGAALDVQYPRAALGPRPGVATGGGHANPDIVISKESLSNPTSMECTICGFVLPFQHSIYYVHTTCLGYNIYVPCSLEYHEKCIFIQEHNTCF